MNSRRWCRSLQIFIILCGRLDRAVAESGVSSAPTNGEPFSSATPAPGGTTARGTGVSLTEEDTLQPALDSMVTTVTTTPVSEVPAVATEAATTVKPEVTQQGCLCDLTPDFCDIGCCCDTVDCGVVNSSTIFSGCPQKVISGVCIEKWLMFRANVDSSLVTVTDSLFCVRPEADSEPQSLPAQTQYPALGDSYQFSPPGHTSITHSRDFYRVDDVIQTYLSNSSVRGLLRQPSPGAAAAFCINRNPAKFLRSVSLSCTRMVTPQLCTTDPNLNARAYFSDLSLIKIPVAEIVPVSDFLVPVTPLFDWPAPSQQNNSCINAVEKVEFVIGYTGRGELTYATVNVVLADVDPNQMLLQTHSVYFQLATPSPTPGPIPAVGLTAGFPVIGRSKGEVKPLTSQGVSQGGECSSDLSGAPILFAHNTVTGCTFSSPARNCSDLHSQIYRILQDTQDTPDVIAMNSGSQPNWTRVITQGCPVSLQETCESGCVLPHSLSIQVLWARQGLIDLPQNYILGAKYLFHCQKFKCPMSSPVALTTKVTFADTTVYPEPPRGSPQPHWKFPFGFFTRGAAELDGHVVINRSHTEKVTWSLMLFTVTLLTGLEFFTT